MDPIGELIKRKQADDGTITYDEVVAALPPDTDVDTLAVALDRAVDAGLCLIDEGEPPPTASAPPVPLRVLEIPDLYHRDAAFDAHLRALGVPFTDAMCSHDPRTGLVFDAELIVPGDRALAAWLALRNAVPVTGLWPVINGTRAPDNYNDATPDTLDPRQRYSKQVDEWIRGTSEYEPVWSVENVRADAAQNLAEAETVPPSRWTGARPVTSPVLTGPNEPITASEPNFAAQFANEGPFRCARVSAGGNDWPIYEFLRVRLYPTTVPWQAFAFEPFGGWNDAPWVDVQLAMLKRWHDAFGAELVSVPGDWYELFVPRPPRTRHEALRAAHEMHWFGEETIFGYTLPSDDETVERMRTAHYWHFWWD